MELKDTIGNNIVKRRRQQHMTQQSLASKSGISVSYLRSIEHGTANATVDVLDQISASLNIEPSSLLQTNPNYKTDPDNSIK